MWTGTTWTNDGSFGDITLDDDTTFGAWTAGYRPTQMFITVSDTLSREFTVSLGADGGAGEIISSDQVINLTPAAQSFQFDLDFTGLDDIFSLSIQTSDGGEGTIELSCIQFDPP